MLINYYKVHHVLYYIFVKYTFVHIDETSATYIGVVSKFTTKINLISKIERMHT